MKRSRHSLCSKSASFLSSLRLSGINVNVNRILFNCSLLRIELTYKGLFCLTKSSNRSTK